MGKFDKAKKTPTQKDKAKAEKEKAEAEAVAKKGRGHKQKGSGNVIVGKAPVVTNDGVVLKAHERLPTQVLQEWCQREKRPTPRYKPRPPGNRHMVFVNDAKNSLHDMNFCPIQTDYESEKVAKDYAALLALVEVQGKMPLENKLPEPYRTVWKELIASKKEKDKKKDVKKSAGGVTTAAAASTPASGAVPRKLPAAPKDFMFGNDDEDDNDKFAEPPLPPALSGAMVAIGELDPATADWLCNGCNTQNFATLASGQARTKCFKCGVLRNDACELVQPTIANSGKADKEPAALKNLQTAFQKSQRDESREQQEEKKSAGRPYAFKGSHTGAAQVVQRGGGGKNRQHKGGKGEGGGRSATARGPAAVLDLQAKNSAAVQARAKEEYNLLKRRRAAYFDAVKRANRPSTVTISPVLRQQLEEALGLDTGAGDNITTGGLKSGDNHDSAALETVPDDLDSYLSILQQLQEENEQEQEQLEEKYYLPVDASRVSQESQKDALRMAVESLLETGFRETQAIQALEATRTEQRDRLLDEMDDYAGSDFRGKLRDSLRVACLEWLCLHLEEKDLPQGFELNPRMTNPGISMVHSKSKNSLTALSRASSTSSLASSAQGASGSHTTATELADYGWQQADIFDALNLCRKGGGGGEEGEKEGLLLTAGVLLCNASMAASGDAAYSKVVLDPSFSIPNATTNGGSAFEEGVSVEEECDVLQSIYTEEHFSLSTSRDGVHRITVEIETTDLLAALNRSENNNNNGANGVVVVSLHVFVHSSMGYPAKPPLVLLHCPRLRARGVLLQVQQLVWRKAQELKGDSMIYSLASWVQEDLAGELASPAGVNAAEISTPPSSGLRTWLSQEAQTLWPAITAAAFDKELNNTDINIVATGDQKEEETSVAVAKGADKGANAAGKKGKGGPFWRRQRGAALQKPAARPGREKRQQMTLVARKKLPAWGSREEFLKAIEASGGMVVTGETGCGKTTQIPQYIHEQNPDAKVVICQPRRLAAVGVATRVAEELCCELGQEVGYMVRGDSKCTAMTRLAFCTYGVLLRRLQSDPLLEGIDYVILDEVHERGVDSDFGLALLVTALGNAKSLFKLILMSATISTDKFASYLGNALAGKYQPENCRGKRGFKNGITGPPAAVLSIPGFTFDVDMFYKADYEELLRGDSTTTSPLLAKIREKEGNTTGEEQEGATNRYRPARDTLRIGGPLLLAKGRRRRRRRRRR